MILNGRQRILSAINLEEGDRVPISPRVHIWLMSEYGDASLASLLKHLPDIDPMYIVPSTPPNIIDSYPDEYHIPQVKVKQKKYRERPFLIIERTFATPAGCISDTTRIPEAGQEFGIDPQCSGPQCRICPQPSGSDDRLLSEPWIFRRASINLSSPIPQPY